MVCSSVSAYEPDLVHKVLVGYALDTYSKCYPDDSVYNEKIRQRIIQGNLAMDNGLKADVIERLRLKEEVNLLPIKRVNHWHFYNKSRQHLSKAGVIDQSMQGLWLGIQDGIKLNKSVFDKTLFVGGLIHLLEDMTVPAHVVPVYHGPVEIKTIGPRQLSPLVSYMLEADHGDYLQEDGGFVVIKDGIDGMAVDDRRVKEILTTATFCHELATLPKQPDELRDWQAQLTLALLETPIAACEGFYWGHFWLKPQGDSYFGRYNIHLQQPFFGQAGGLIEDNRVCRFSSNDQRYRDFVFQQHLAAIKADVVLLRWASQKYLH